jgi:YHS domain-containing protein
MMAKDFVCGMDVDEKTAQYTTTYNGTIYYFCALGCKKAFDENPEKYVGGSKEHSGHGCCCGHC